MKVPLMLDTKRMAIWDGPGIRTTFFVKGCPLRCIWCHNPESIRPEAQWARFQHLCKHHEHCTMDEATCPTRALKLYGKPMKIPKIVAKALEDKAFYDQSGGGVTLSGGEPLFFWEWAAELFKAFKAAGLHTCLDTSLYAPPAAMDAMLPVTDLWLPDYKADDDTLHQKFTGVSNAIIRNNLERLVAAKAKLEVRCLADARTHRWGRHRCPPPLLEFHWHPRVVHRQSRILRLCAFQVPRAWAPRHDAEEGDKQVKVAPPLESLGCCRSGRYGIMLSGKYTILRRESHETSQI